MTKGSWITTGTEGPGSPSVPSVLSRELDSEYNSLILSESSINSYNFYNRYKRYNDYKYLYNLRENENKRSTQCVWHLGEEKQSYSVLYRLCASFIRLFVSSRKEVYVTSRIFSVGDYKTPYLRPMETHPQHHGRRKDCDTESRRRSSFEFIETSSRED